MRRVLRVLLWTLFILTLASVTIGRKSFSAEQPVKKKLARYNISKNDLMREIHLVNSVIFNKDIDKWDMLMVGTVAAETNFGQYKGKSKLGITQVSSAGLGYVKSRLTEEDKFIIKIFGYDHSKIKLADMEHDVRLALVIGGLYYKHKLKDVPPKTENDCAIAWKKYYNTSAGKGTVKGYTAKYKYHAKTTMLAFYNIDKDTLLVRN